MGSDRGAERDTAEAMSQKNIDCLAGFFDAFNRRDLPALLKCCDVDIAADYRGILIGTPTYRGHAGIEQLFRDMAAAWEELRSDRMEVIADGGDDLVLVGEAVGRGRTTGAPFVAQGALHVRFTRGKVVGMRGFRTEREAFEAAGIRN
jgi:ketosteroid isomerase-like protein